MHNLETVLKFEIIRTLKKPTFWISVLAIPALLGAILGVTYFSQSSNEAQQAEINKEPFSVLIQDESKIISDQIIESIGGVRSSNRASAIDAVKNEKFDAYFYYPQDITKSPVEVFNKNDGLMGNDKYSFVAKQLLVAAASEKIGSTDLIKVAKGEIVVTQKNFSNAQEVNIIGSMIAPAAFLVIFYSIIVLLGNQMLASTTEEKENRVTEMLLTSLSSKTLIVGKIISLVILGLIQIATILIPVIFAYVFARETLNIPDLSNFISNISFEFWPIFIGAGMLISGFLLFTGLLVGIGAAAPTAKDANGFFGVVILLMFIPIYFIPMLISATPSLVANILTFFPLTAPITIMARNTFGTIGFADAIIGLVIVFISGVIAINIAIQIFRYGTLEYSKRLSLKTVFGKYLQKKN
jgi:ABC-2 type transport system permease protein